MLSTNVIHRCRAVAFAHETMGHKKYGEFSYLYHLSMVECALMTAGVELEDEELGALLVAAWAHDSIEDAGVTYNDIAGMFGTPVAEIVLCVTNDIRGRNRHERHMSVIPGLQKNPMGRVLKLADRLANMSDSHSSMFKKYAKEYDGFRADLYGVGVPSTGKLSFVERNLWLQLDSIAKDYRIKLRNDILTSH